MCCNLWFVCMFSICYHNTPGFPGIFSGDIKMKLSIRENEREEKCNERSLQHQRERTRAVESIEFREQWLLYLREEKKGHISAQTETRDKTGSSALLSHALSCHLDMPSIQLLISIGLPP